LSVLFDVASARRCPYSLVMVHRPSLSPFLCSEAIRSVKTPLPIAPEAASAAFTCPLSTQKVLPPPPSDIVGSIPPTDTYRATGVSVETMSYSAMIDSLPMIVARLKVKVFFQPLASWLSSAGYRYSSRTNLSSV